MERRENERGTVVGCMYRRPVPYTTIIIYATVGTTTEMNVGEGLSWYPYPYYYTYYYLRHRRRFEVSLVVVVFTIACVSLFLPQCSFPPLFRNFHSIPGDDNPLGCLHKPVFPKSRCAKNLHKTYDML
jgi:hypothetical protein